ncbi:transposable element Tc1 transposase [Trichonephila clavipes]|nr:transposable element Tc1 transposase [Trichonephila clavipes]
MGSKPREDLQVCKCIAHVCGTEHSKYSSSKKSSSRGRWKGKRGGKPPDKLPRNYGSKLGWNGDKTYCHLHCGQSCSNDRCKISLLPPGMLSVQRKPGQVYPRATTSREDRYFSIIERHNSGAIASQISRKLYAATGTQDSSVTVSRRLHEKELFVTRHICVPLSFLNRRVGLKWCRNHRCWRTD